MGRLRFSMNIYFLTSLVTFVAALLIALLCRLAGISGPTVLFLMSVGATAAVIVTVHRNSKQKTRLINTGV